MRLRIRGTKFTQGKSRKNVCVFSSSVDETKKEKERKRKEKKRENAQIGISVVWLSFISKTSDNSDLLHDIHDLSLAFDHHKITHELKLKSPMERETDSFSAISLQNHSKHSNTGMYFRRPRFSKIAHS